jgi:hypothetical protein
VWYLTYHYTYVGYNADPNVQANIDAYKREIQESQASGVDGWELDYVGINGLWNTHACIFKAAEQIAAADTSKPPFWLYMSPETDYAGSGAATFTDTNGVNHGNWILCFLQQYKNSPCYYKINGAPVLGSFLGPERGDVQTDLANLVFAPMGGATSIFYVPAMQTTNGWTTDGTNMTSWAKTYLSSVRHWTGSDPNSNINNMNNIQRICAANSKPIVFGVENSSEYWDTHSATGGLYFNRNGGEGADAEWTNAIAKNPIFISETTWNDWAETYGAWADVPHVSTVGSGYPYDYLLQPHRGVAVQRIYYAQWYTSGVNPTITQDQLIAWYRTMPLAGESAPPPVAWPSGVPDNIYTQTFLTAAATLRVSTGGTVTNYNLNAGVNFTQTGFNPGTQNFQLIRGGTTIVSCTGVAIQTAGHPNNAHYATCYALPGVSYPAP